MTEKRFTHEKWYDERKIKENGELFAIVDVYNQADTICNRLNELFDENEKLKKERRIWLESQEEFECLSEENEQLKQQRHEWINSVKREEIDKIFKMSIFEIAEAFEYYQKRIKELESDLNDT